MLTIRRAGLQDAEALLALQKLAYQSEARLYNDWSLPPLTQSIESLLAELRDSVCLKAMAGERIVGSVRGKVVRGVCAIGRLVVHPDHQGRGLGSLLLKELEDSFPDVSKYELFTGCKSEANIRLYLRHGYARTRTQTLSPTVSVIFFEKIRQATP